MARRHRAATLAETDRLGRPSKLDRRTRARIHRLRGSGHSLRKIGAMVGVSHPTVIRALRSKDTVKA